MNRTSRLHVVISKYHGVTLKRTHRAMTSLLLPTFLLVAALLASDHVTRGSDDHSLEYYVTEELAPGSRVGNLVVDFGLAARYNRSVLDTLRFSFLTQPAQLDRAYFSIDERTGELVNSARIDRERLCPRMDPCTVNFDIAVQPIQYFEIVKVGYCNRFIVSKFYHYAFKCTIIACRVARDVLTILISY